MAEKSRKKKCAQPPTGGIQNGSSVGSHVHVAYTFSQLLPPTRVLSRRLLNKISASEPRQEFIKGVLMVGCAYQVKSKFFVEILS